eukprot:snap_masked-scaffold_19-processed-gene-1.33-mRNA-1 protein AED:1.00 eAED:1.00 QI:0/-1/0/0/-1/1/1/0/198
MNKPYNSIWENSSSTRFLSSDRIPVSPLEIEVVTERNSHTGNPLFSLSGPSPNPSAAQSSDMISRFTWRNSEPCFNKKVVKRVPDRNRDSDRTSIFMSSFPTTAYGGMETKKRSGSTSNSDARGFFDFEFSSSRNLNLLVLRREDLASEQEIFKRRCYAVLCIMLFLGLVTAGAIIQRINQSKEEIVPQAPTASPTVV